MYENNVTIIGNIVNTPELRTTKAGDPFCSFRVAHTTRRRTDSGWEDIATSFYNVSAFQALGMNAHRSLAAGQPVVVHGRLRINNFLRKDGTSGTSAEIQALSVGHHLGFGHSVFTKTAGLQQYDTGDRLSDPAVQAAFHGSAQFEPESEDDPGYDVVDQVTGEVRSWADRPEPQPAEV